MAKLLEHNMHAVDRGLRIAVGLVLLGLAFWGPQTPWGYIGIIPLLTGISGICPLYSIIGIRTCPAKEPETKA